MNAESSVFRTHRASMKNKPDRVGSGVRSTCYRTALETPLQVKFVLTVFVALLLSTSVYAASPFVGKWKIDQTKSHIAGATDSVTAAGPNTWTFTYGAFSWTVKADEIPQSTPFGNTAMKVVNPKVWEFTSKNKDNATEIETWVLANDGKSMIRKFKGRRENGEPFSSAATMKRIAGESGFEGTWESTVVQMTFTEVDIEANGEDGVTLHLPEDGTGYALKFDGKDYPEEGPRVPPGMTVSAKMKGARKAEATTKLNGKVFDKEEWEVSPDGKTFSYTQRDSGRGKPSVIVLHRSETGS